MGEYDYPAEKFSDARHALMLPHPDGEEDSIARAFAECMRGLRDLDRSRLDDKARAWVKRLEELMETTGLSDTDAVGLLTVKARKFSLDEKFELSRIVDDLAHWFHRKFWERD